MAFTITIDYRFDSTGFFDSPERRAALEAAADAWENIILDEFDDLPIGTTFDIRNPTTFVDSSVTLTSSVDDMIIFVGASALSGSTLAVAGPDGLNAAGDVYAARISSNFRDAGPVTDFEPWAGSITFDTDTSWYFGSGTPAFSQSDFTSVAIHEIGHILGVGTSGAFDEWILNDVFTGPNAKAANGGQGVPLETDHGHVQDGYANDQVILDPSLTQGTRLDISDIDKAILADIGYEISGFTKQGTTPEIATSAGERIFGRDVADVINGLGGNDTVQGAGGNDELRGGAGDDLLFGQDGIDTFVIGKGDDQNTISDFDLGTETIRLIDSGFASAADAAAAVTKTASNVSRLTFTDGTTVDVFHNSQTGTPLNASHFEVVTTSSAPPTLPTPTNVLPTGAVTISGELQVGSTLTAETGTIQDANGLGTFTYTWLRDGSLVSGETGASLALTEADLGAQFQVRVTFIDGGGREETLLSAATTDVQAAPAPSAPDPSADTPDTNEEDVVDTETDPTGDSTDSGTTTPGNNPPEGVLAILGTARVGETLTARPNGIFDTDGIDPESKGFEWLRNGEPIAGETGQTYVVTVDDVGAEISLRYTYTDLLGTVETVVSEPKPSVPADTGDNGEDPVDGDGGTDGDAGVDGGDTDGGSGTDGDGSDGGTDGDTGGDDTPPPEEDKDSDGVNDAPVTATKYNDVFTARLGMDTVDGGDGVDTIVFAGEQSNYTLNISADGVVVIDRRDDGLGTIHLENIERVGFEVSIPGIDGTMDLRQFAGQADLSDADFEGFIEMYIAYFNRAPDAVGLSFWATAYANGTSLEEIARLFVDQEETRNTYPDNVSNIKFVSEVYDNVLGRAPDLEGLMFWRKALDSGSVSRDEFILEILRGVDAAPAAGASSSFVEKQQADQAFLEMKTDLGAHFAVHRGLSDVNDAISVMAMFDGSQSSLQAAIAAIDAAYAEALDPANGEFLMPLVGVLDDPFLA